MKKLFVLMLSLVLATSVWADVLEPPFYRTRGIAEAVIEGITEPQNIFAHIVVPVWLGITVVAALLAWKTKRKARRKFFKWFLICVGLCPIFFALLLDISDYFKIGNAIKEIKYQIMCTKDKPLFDGRRCYSCNEPRPVVGYHDHRGVNCEICPNREYAYNECVSWACVLKNAPDSNYKDEDCGEWVTEQ